MKKIFLVILIILTIAFTFFLLKKKDLHKTITSEPTFPIEDISPEQNQSLSLENYRQSLELLPSSAPIDDQTLIIDQNEYLLVQELQKNSNTSFRLLVDKTNENQQEVIDAQELAACFNGDGPFSTTRENAKPYLSIWKENQVQKISSTPLEQLGHAGNGCIQAWKWENDQLLFRKNGNSSFELWSYNPETEQIVFIASITLWRNNVLGEPSNLQLMWKTNHGIFFQNEETNGYYGDIYTLSVNEAKQFQQYEDVLDSNKIVHKTNGHIALSDIFDEKNLKSMNKGLFFTINSQEYFLPW